MAVNLRNILKNLLEVNQLFTFIIIHADQEAMHLLKDLTERYKNNMSNGMKMIYMMISKSLIEN